MTAPFSPITERIVRERYAAAAQVREAALCCPVEYEPRYLEAIPEEVIERDYGCGDPSRFVRPGDRVLDLGSGTGKICFIAAQIVGAKGSVVGVDLNDEMLGLARRAAPQVAEQIGYANVEFRRGRIQDLGLDLDRVEARLQERPVHSAADLVQLGEFEDELRNVSPMIPDASIDVVVSNCVLNLVREADKTRLIREIFRVLRPGGRIAISDIVSDENVPEHLKADPELWSGCVSGAFRDHELLSEIEDAGFHGARIESWASEPFAVVEGIEFRSITLSAYRPDAGPCLEAQHAVVYRGPWRQVEDDDGHVLRRGVRTAVCAKTYARFTSEPYADELIPIPPRVETEEAERELFDCARTDPRHPRETKGDAYRATRVSGGCC